MAIPSDIKKKGVLLAGDVILIAVSIYLSALVRLHRFVNVIDVYTGATFFSVMIFIVGYYIFDLYNLNYKVRTAPYLVRINLAAVTGTVTTAVTFYFLPSYKFGRGVFLLDVLFVLVLTYVWRLFFASTFKIAHKRKNIVIIGAGSNGRSIYKILTGQRTDFRVKGFLDDNPELWDRPIGQHTVVGGTSALDHMVISREIDSAVIAITHEKSPELLQSVMEAKMKGIEIYDMPSLYEEVTGRLPVVHLRNGWLVYSTFKGMRRNLYTLRLKRLLDVCLSFAGLVLSFPLMLAAALAIKLESCGPVLYKQKRVGLNEEIFTLFKFRSMNTDAEANGAVWAVERDPRVTRVGRIIRKTRIDEIPQMWNVLRGSMSFIGPRPERSAFVAGLKQEIPFYSLRHSVKPGITGWAQVSYRYGASTEDALEKLQYDLFYIKNLSAFLDMHIILRTIRVVLFGKGAR